MWVNQMSPMWVIGPQYDLKGRLVAVKHDRTDPIYLKYDELYLREVQWKNLRSQYEKYNISGGLLRGNGVEYTYDSACRLTGWQKGEYQESVIYNEVGNLTQRSLLGLDTSYEYDSLNQLEKEGGAYEKTYSHDSHYNRRSKNGKDYTVDRLNCPTAYGEALYTWDRNGNLIEKIDEEGKTEYIYDAKDRLIALKKEGVLTQEYLWDEQSRCLKAGDVKLLYQGRKEVGSVEDDQLTSFRVLGLGRGQESGASLWVQVQQEIFSPLHDLSGNLIALTDSEGRLVEHTPLSAFGEKLEGGASLSPWVFSSKREDKGSGLILFGYRFYDPALGRFITADPTGFDAGPNLWAYCNNNPLTFTDLFGLSAIAYLNSELESSHHEDRSSSSQNNSDRSSAAPKEPEARATSDLASPSVKPMVVNSPTGVEMLGGAEKVQQAKESLNALNQRYKQGIYAGFNPTSNLNQSEWVWFGDNLTNSKVVLVGSCGMQTSIEAGVERAKYTSDNINGDTCFWFVPYCPDIGQEVLMTTMEKAGLKTEAQMHFKKGVEVLSEIFGSDSQFVMPTFSRGNLLIKNSARQWKKGGKSYQTQIDLISMASPSLIGRNECKNVVMHISENDGVAYLMGLARLNPPEHLHIHKSNVKPPIDHAFDGEVYRNVYKYEVIDYYLNLTRKSEL
ncbi:MAG: RHS repeat-associated core domain-containing protein [Chlamydiia bacterium]|nr:RHS repeat-associated core domain-containing protein [Chlamydiia bacterium]